MNTSIKKKIALSLIAAFLITAKPAFAAVTPTSTPQVSSSEEQINNLKDRIASRVAQLNLVEKKGIIGTVTDVSETQLSVTKANGDVQLVDVDELTKFSSPSNKTSSKTSFGISDINKGAIVGVIGLYNKDSHRLLARWVDMQSLPQILSGGIVTLDKDAFTITVATLTSSATLINVEDITKTVSYTKSAGTVRSGFSKLQQNQRIYVVGFPDTKDKGAIIASRILVFPELPVNPRIPLVNPTDIAPVSTGSGKKLTPIAK